MEGVGEGGGCVREVSLSYRSDLLSHLATVLGRSVSDGVVFEEAEEETVRYVLKNVNAGKASGPDGVCGGYWNGVKNWQQY